MRDIVIFLQFLITSFSVYTQAPEIEWQNTIGGSANDVIQAIQETIDGGYILGGYSDSGIFGDKTEASFGGYDYWVVKLNSFGNIVWQKTIGGGSNDILKDLQITLDGGYILCGYSNSEISGNKTEESIVGSNDYWVVKTDTLGNIEWQNTIGGAGNDEFHSLAQAGDGGYVLGGRSNSPISVDKTEASDGYYDYWVVKIDDTGEIQWENTIGGDEYDYLYSVCSASENSVLIGGYSNSPLSGDKTDVAFTGSGDFWILKLDSLGNIIWQNAIGGNDADFLFNISPALDESFYLKGYSGSGISSDKTEANQGFYDYWTVKIDSVGNIIWQKTIGGSSEDISRMKQYYTLDNYLFSGSSLSGISGNKTEPNIGFEDYWVVQLDTLGNIEWQKTIGGWLGDFLTSIDTTQDGGYILGGYSSSPISGDKTEDNIGSNDFWIIKLKGNCTNYTFYADNDGDGYGGLMDSVISCEAPDGYELNNDDCDDANNLIYPIAIELCNGLDDNCNSYVDEGIEMYNYFIDADNDGYGNIFIELDTCSEVVPEGYVTDSMDCDDANNLIHPDAIELCNGLDENCNGIADEGLALYSLFIDGDNDNFGNEFIDTISCFDTITGYVFDNTDCDDTNPNIFPGAPEIQNLLDDNCNDTIDEGIIAIEDVNSYSFLMYPNPNNGIFTIQFPNANSKFIYVEVFNLLDEIIYSGQFNYADEVQIILPAAFAGIAYVLIKTEKRYMNNLIYVLK